MDTVAIRDNSNNDDNINNGNFTFKVTSRRNGLTLLGTRKQSVTLYGNQNLQNTTTDLNNSKLIYNNKTLKFQHSFLPDDYYAEEIEKMNLKFPENLKFKEIINVIEEPAKKNDDIITINHNLFEQRLLGLPGELDLNMNQTEKYFGEKSRESLYERYRWLHSQRNITTKSLKDDFQKLYFENEKLEMTKHVPFGSIRPNQAFLELKLQREQEEELLRQLAVDDLDDVSSSNNSKAATNSLISETSSKFRSRFKPVIVIERKNYIDDSVLSINSNNANDILRLKESAMRSGIKEQDFEDDLTHHQEDRMLAEQRHLAKKTTMTTSTNLLHTANTDRDDNGSVISEVSNTSSKLRSNVPFRVTTSNNHNNDHSKNIANKEIIINNSSTSNNKQDPKRKYSNSSKSTVASATSKSIKSSNSVKLNPIATERKVTKQVQNQEQPTLTVATSVAAAVANKDKMSLSMIKGSPTPVVSQNTNTSLRNRQLSVKPPRPRSSMISTTLKRNSTTSSNPKINIERNFSYHLTSSDVVVENAEDRYSQIILEKLIEKFKILNAPKPVEFKEENEVLINSKRDDASVGSMSTIATLDLGLFLDENNQLKNVDGQGTGGVGGSSLGVPIVSPRTKYLTGCMKNNLNPRASLVIRKNISKRLNLQHHGMGDQMAVVLAESLQGLPFVESINIADNMLTDIGMGPIIRAIVGIPSLLELDLSQNEIGPISAKALNEYLISSTCPLERLILNCADVDDFECERFVDAIKSNKSLLELELSNNKIGSAENLNTVMPDLVTGGEALAELLRSSLCNLRTLKVDWNMIRLDGAIDFANSLSNNNTLTYLDLSYNSLSTEGGITMGMSLLENKTLQTLKMNCNQLDSVACITICAGIIENRGLKRVFIDGNPIGEQGMRALMLIPIIAGNRVKVSASACNISLRDSKCSFDFEKSIGEYKLDMSKGFERAIVIILLHMIAGHHSYIFSKFSYEKHPGWIPKEIKLVQYMSKERSHYFDAKQQRALDGLVQLKNSASNIMSAVQLFQEVDLDGSGELDVDELKYLFDKMGMDMSARRVKELFDQYDVDQGGNIELPEFLLMLKAINKDTQARIRELIESPVMALKSIPDVQYLPPKTGFLSVTVEDGFAKKKNYRILSSSDREYIQEVTKDLGGTNAAKMIKSGLKGAKLRLEEGIAIADRMLLDSQDKVAIIKTLLLQMNDTDDARNLILSLLNGDRTDLLRLKKEFGVALRPILGNPNGYYTLDLSKIMDRMCIERLLEVSATTAAKRCEASKLAPGRVGDLSQKGNWSSFRNERFNGESITLGPVFAQPIPTSGFLEFDFSGGVRASKEDLPITDLRIVKILMNHALLDPNLSPLALVKLLEYQNDLDRALSCDGTTYFEVPMARARLIGEGIEQFYNNLEIRAKHFAECSEREASVLTDDKEQLINMFDRDPYPIPLSIDEQPNEIVKIGPLSAAVCKLGGAAPLVGRRGQVIRGNKKGDDDGSVEDLNGGGSLITLTTGDETDDRSRNSDDQSDMNGITIATAAAGGKINKSNENDSDLDDDGQAAGLTEEEIAWQQELDLIKSLHNNTMSNKQISNNTFNKVVKRENIAVVANKFNIIEGDKFLDKMKELLSNPLVQAGAKAQRIIDLLEEMFSKTWLLVRQLTLIVECFAKHGYIRQTKYHGTYRVDLIIALFARIIDIHNFELVLKVLSPNEVACLYCRLGWLNIYNPSKPEGSWELDMSRREERVVAKTLCCLATLEPGDNWLFQTFRWMRSMESMPGWNLTQPWLTEEGMPMRGLVNITYYSGEAKGKHGCRPYVSFRKALLNLVLINENEIVVEEIRNRPSPATLPGDKAFDKHLSLWYSYLCPEYVDPNRKR